MSASIMYTLVYYSLFHYRTYPSRKVYLHLFPTAKVRLLQAFTHTCLDVQNSSLHQCQSHFSETNFKSLLVTKIFE